MVWNQPSLEPETDVLVPCNDIAAEEYIDSSSGDFLSRIGAGDRGDVWLHSGCLEGYSDSNMLISFFSFFFQLLAARNFKT